MQKTIASSITCRRNVSWQASIHRLRTWAVTGALFVGASLLTAGTLRANTEDDILSGLAAGSNLSLSSSYSTTAPSTGGVPTAASDVVFTAAGTYANSYLFGSSLSIGSLDDLSATAITLQNNTGTLTLNGGNSVSGTTADLLYVAAGGNLTITADNGFTIALGAAGNFNVAGTATINAAITGGFALAKTGAGTLTLGGFSTYTGGTTVSAGTLALNTGGGAGAVRGAVTVNTGGTLNLSAGDSLGYGTGTSVTTLNINGGTVNTTGNGNQGFITGLNFTGGTFSSTGGGVFNINAADASAPGIASNASAATALISTGIDIRGGTLGFTVASGTTASGVDLSITGAITSLGGNFGLTKTGAGNLSLGAFDSYKGGTTVNGGTLTLAVGGGSGTVQGAITVNTGATLNLAVKDTLGYNAGAAVTTVSVNGGTVNNTSGNNEGFLTSFVLMGGTVTSTAPNAGIAGSYLFNLSATTPPTITSNASATTSVISAPLFIQNAGSLGIAVASGTTASGNDLTISGAITGSTATSGFTKTGTGRLNLTGQSTFQGGVAISGGTVNVGVAGADNGTTGALGNVSAGKTITVASGATLSGTVNNWFGNGGSALPTVTLNGGTLTTTRYTSIGALNLNGAAVTTTDATDGPVTGGNYQTFQLRGTVTVGGTAGSTISTTTSSATTGGIHLDTNTTFTVNSTGAVGADLTVSAPLRNRSADFQGTAGGLTKAGAGTMLLTATNTYAGGTTVSAGTLLTSGTGTLGAGNVTVSGGALTLGSSVSLADTATLTFAGSTTEMTITLNNTTADALAYIINSNNPATMIGQGTYTASQLDTIFGVTSFTGPGSLTIAAVPEPSTVFGGALLTVALGWHLCCRRRQMA